MTVKFIQEVTLKTFISECCQLSWRMNISYPPLHISVDTSIKFDDKLHTVFRSLKMAGASIDHYIWPVLFDREGGEILVKGKVYLKQ